MVDDVGGKGTQLTVLPLGGADQQLESLLGGTAANGHQDADRMLDGGAGRTS